MLHQQINLLSSRLDENDAIIVFDRVLLPWDDVLHVGLSRLRLEPRAFWALTPIEFSAMTGALRHRQERLSRGGLEAMMAVFATHGYERVKPPLLEFEEGLLAHLRNKRRDVLDFISSEDPKVKGDAESKIKSAIDEFARDFG